MITNLVRTENRRFWLRRATRVTFLVLLLGAAALMTLVGWKSTSPISDSERAQAAIAAQQNNAQFPADQKAQCIKDRQAQQAKQSDDTHIDCGDATPDTFLRHRSTRADLLGDVTDMTMQLGTIGVLVAVASFIGAEFSSGSLGNQLTFDPRRGPTFWAKVLAAAIGSMVFAVVMAAVSMAIAFLVSAIHHADAGQVPGGTAHWSWVMVRSVLALGIVGAVVAAIAILLRHTAAVLGLAFAYMIGVQIVGVNFPRTQAVNLMTNLSAFVHGSATYEVDSCASGPQGYQCQPVDHLISMWHGTAVIAIAALVALALALLVFRRRDVN